MNKSEELNEQKVHEWFLVPIKVHALFQVCVTPSESNEKLQKESMGELSEDSEK